MEAATKLSSTVGTVVYTLVSCWLGSVWGAVLTLNGCSRAAQPDSTCAQEPRLEVGLE